jgi:hypothetical protein
MTIPGSHGLFFSEKSLMFLMQLNNCSRIFRLSKTAPSWESAVIMEENFRISDLKNFATHMAFNRSFHPPLLLNIMGL